MELVKKKDAILHKNSETCSALEYLMQNSDINLAIVSISGRYPEEGYVVNEICAELAFVQSGHGIIEFQDGRQEEVKINDTILIEPKEIYFWKGVELTLVIASSPAWTPDQHSNIV